MVIGDAHHGTLVEPFDKHSVFIVHRRAGRSAHRCHALRAQPLGCGDEVLARVVDGVRRTVLQRQFEAAHATLDEAQTLLTDAMGYVRTRYLLERGRVFNSSGKPDQARPFFRAAWDKAQAGKLEDLAVDAAHMLVILDGQEWNLKALALAT